MTLHRRALFGWLGAGAAAAAATPATAQGQPRFLHGVASGDPDQHSAVFWTRVTPPDGSSEAIRVELQVAADADFTRMVRESIGLEAEAARDFTVKHDLDGQGLEPGTEYFYRFKAGDVLSPVGRVRTLPQRADQVVLSVVSCQLHPGGLFNAYEALAREPRLDAVIHLGDYIYEYGAGDDDYGMAAGAALGRVPVPAHEIITLADYRARHAQYKSDPDLQAAHARAAFISVWDDHEVTNDGWQLGAQNHQPETEGDWAERKAAALKAYFEWMPIREPAQGLSREAIYRSFDFGDLATLAMVETRLLARGEQLDYERELPARATPADVAAFEARRWATDRDLIGDDQRRWVRDVLKASREAGRPWQIVGNQVVMARVKGPDVSTMANPLQIAALLLTLPAGVRAQVRRSIDLFKLGVPFNLDSWDGYPYGRERLYAAFKDAGVLPLVLAGDSHAFWVNDLKDAEGERRAVEFGTTSISSPSPGDAAARIPLGAALAAANEEVVFCDQTAKGYLRLTLTPDQARADLVAVSTITAKPFDTRVVKSFTVDRQDAGLGEIVEA